MGLKAGSRRGQLSVGQRTKLTTSLTNGKKRLSKGPAHRRGRREAAAAAAVAAGHCPSRRAIRTPSLPLTSPRSPPALICDTRLFWVFVTQLAKPRTRTMFPVKVKVEKSGENPEIGGLKGSTMLFRVSEVC